MGKYEDLENLNKLKSNGIISEQEFEDKKKLILAESKNDENKNQEIIKKYSSKAKKDNRKMIVISLSIIGLAFFLCIIIPFISIQIEKSNEREVPDLVGMTFAEAQEKLDELDLILEANNEEPDSIITYQKDKYKKKKGETVEVTTEKQIYITQDSEISPTGKEFIGKFSDNLKQIFDNDAKNYNNFYSNIYQTSNKNIKMYSAQYYVTNMREPGVEEIFYYNDINNDILAHVFVVNDIKNYESALINNGYTLEKMMSTKFNASINIFLNLVNDQSEAAMTKAEQYYDSISSMNATGYKTFTYNNWKYSYKVIGNDLLYVEKISQNSKNKMEVLCLAYDKETNAENIIKKWEASIYRLDN